MQLYVEKSSRVVISAQHFIIDLRQWFPTGVPPDTPYWHP